MTSSVARETLLGFSARSCSQSWMVRFAVGQRLVWKILTHVVHPLPPQDHPPIQFVVRDPWRLSHQLGEDASPTFRLGLAPGFRSPSIRCIYTCAEVRTARSRRTLGSPPGD